MSWPDTPAFRMRYPAAASPPNPPPTICAFICLLPGTPGWEVPPTRARSSKQRIVSLTKRAHQEDRPSVLPVGIYACCVTAKLRRGYGGMARRASGFVARVADGDNTAHQPRKYLFVFRDIDMNRVEGSSALIRRAHQ